MATLSKYYLLDLKHGTIQGVDETIEGIVKQWERTDRAYTIMTPVTWRTEIKDLTNTPTSIESEGK